MPRNLRSSVKRKRSQWHPTLQSITSLVPKISGEPSQSVNALDQREFLALLDLMPVKCTAKPTIEHGLEAGKSCRDWYDEMDQYILKRNIDIGACHSDFLSSIFSRFNDGGGLGVTLQYVSIEFYYVFGRRIS